MSEIKRQCAECRLPKYPEGTKLSHGMCRSCERIVYPEMPEMEDLDGTYYVQIESEEPCPQ